MKHYSKEFKEEALKLSDDPAATGWDHWNDSSQCE